MVGVNWYEANAYCAWLTEQLRAAGKIDERHAVRLPTRTEWERAARSTHGGEYPWGAHFDLALANTEESNLQGTTPAHMYRDGVSPEGVWDLAGNVWEWSVDLHRGTYPWLTGGSWYDDGDRAKASAAVFRFSPGLNLFGFRCCVAPISF